jgi:hypothetical protein
VSIRTAKIPGIGGLGWVLRREERMAAEGGGCNGRDRRERHEGEKEE